MGLIIIISFGVVGEMKRGIIGDAGVICMKTILHTVNNVTSHKRGTVVDCQIDKLWRVLMDTFQKIAFLLVIAKLNQCHPVICISGQYS